MRSQEDHETRPAKLGPIFVSGRQHSGNTVIAFVFKAMDHCFSIDHEGSFFEHRSRLDAMRDPVERARWIADHLHSRDEQYNRMAAEYLPEWAAEHPEADALAQYREMMDHLTRVTGKQFWQQKATAYIYYAEEIFECMPDARMIYMVRNPYDVSASKKRRWPEQERILGWAISWNKGMRIARDFKERYPDRIHLVKYEQLVTDPECTIRGLCEFVGVPFSEALLNVPYVNPAEARRQIVETNKGFSSARAYHYVDRLTPREIAALDMIVSRSAVDREYPDLPHRSQSVSIGTRMGALGLIAIGPLRFSRDKIRLARQTSAGPLVQRMLRRLRA